METTKDEEQLVLLFDSQQVDIGELSRLVESGLAGWRLLGININRSIRRNRFST
jgi:hypothetical protein